MKFRDDISNMNTYIHTYGQAETNMPPHFFKVGGIKIGWGGGEGGSMGGGGGSGMGGQDGCEQRIEVFVKIKKKFFFWGGGGGPVVGGGGGGSGSVVRVDVNKN